MRFAINFWIEIFSSKKLFKILFLKYVKLSFKLKFSFASIINFNNFPDNNLMSLFSSDKLNINNKYLEKFFSFENSSKVLKTSFLFEFSFWLIFKKLIISSLIFSFGFHIFYL